MKNSCRTCWAFVLVLMMASGFNTRCLMGAEAQPVSAWEKFKGNFKKKESAPAESKPATKDTSAVPAKEKVAGEQPKAVETKPAAPAKVQNSNNPIAEEIAQRKSLEQQGIEAQGQVAFANGVELYQQFKFEEALIQFEEAARAMPDHAATKSYIERINKVLGKDENAIRSLSDWEGDTRTVEDQELIITVKHYLEKGKDAVVKAKAIWDNGGAQRSQAMQVLNEARVDFNKSLDAMGRLKISKSEDVSKQELLDAIKGIDALRATWDEEMKKDIKKEAEEQAKNMEKEHRNYREAQVQKLMLQVQSEYLNGRYAKSAGLAKVVLGLDPTNKKAKKLLVLSERKRDEALEKEIRLKSEEEWRRYNEKIRHAGISYSEDLVYPEDWNKISRRKAGSNRVIEDPEWKKRLLQKMDLPVHLIAPQISLEEAISQLQDQTRINFLIDQRLNKDELKISNLSLKDTRLSSALTLILKSVASTSPLVYELRDETIFITNKENQALFKRPETIPYDVTDLITTFKDATLNEGAGLNVGREGLSNVSETKAESTIDAKTIIEIIQSTVEPGSWQDPDGGVSILEYESGKLLVSQTAEAHKLIDELLNMLRQQQKIQVSIEVRFITSQDDDLFELGVDWRGLNEVQLTDSEVTGNSGSGVYSTRNNPARDTRAASILGSSGDAVTSGAPEFITQNRASEGFLAEVSILDPIRAGLALHALDRKETIHDILAPRLTVLNNHQGYIVRSQDTSYVSTYNIENNNLIPVVSRVSSGELLVVRPTVSSDKKYITMDLSPQVTRNVNLEQRPLQFLINGNGNNNNNGGNNGGNFRLLSASVELPNLQVWQVQTRVQVPDGGVVFIGGRMGNIEREAARGVPVLSKIPFLGRLFRTDANYNQLNNLIISVQAKILIFEEIETKLQ